MKIIKTLLQNRKFAFGLSLLLLSLATYLFYPTNDQRPVSQASQVAGSVGKNNQSKNVATPTIVAKPAAIPPMNGLPKVASVLEEKTKKQKRIKPYRLGSRRIGSGEAEEEEDEEEHESHEKEEKERAEFSEERARFDFDLLKDPASGTVPRSAPVKAAEAAKAKALELPNALPLPITVVPRGPNNLGGRTRAIGIDKRNANIMLAGSVSSGVFRSTNGGTTWTRVAPIGQIHNVTAIAQDPRAGQEDTWYYGGGESVGNSATLGSSYRGFGIWKSTDNGLTWGPLASTQTTLEAFDNPFDYVHRIAVDPSTGNVYAAAANTIQRSTDGGSTWSTVLGTFTNSNYTDIIATPSGRIYAAFDGRDAAAAGVWTSTTGASGSWTRIGGPVLTAVPGHANWNPLGTFGRVVLAYAPSNPDIVFALYWRGTTHTSASPVVEAEFYKWDNSTTTWTDLTANLPDEPGYSAGNDPFAVQTGYDLVVAVKPDDINTVFVGGTNVYRSTSGFTNTTATTRIGGYNSPANYALYPNHHPDNHMLLFATGDNNTLYSGNDGGIQKADITQPAVTWTPLNNNYVTYQYYHADISPVNGSSVIMGGAQDNGTTSNPGGTSFSSILGGDGCQTAIISYTDASNFNAIGASQFGNLVRLIGPNSGYTIWPASSGSGIFVTYFHLDQDNTNLLYYADNAALYRTRNAVNITGDNNTGSPEGDPATMWQKMTGIGLSGDIRSLASSRDDAYAGADYTASDANRKLYIGTSAGRVYRLNDPAFVAATTAAVNITPPTATANAIVSSIAVNPWDDNEIMVTYSNYGVVSVFHTFNANSATPTWTEVEGPAGTPLRLGSARSCIITRIGTTTTYIVGNTTGLYSTQALSGATTNWEQVGVNEINFAICASMRLRVSDNRIVLGTHGNGMFELQLPAAIAPAVTVNTSPTGLDFSVDGTPYTTSQVFNWANGSSHTIATTTPQTPTAGTKYLFNNWSDAGAISHSVTATTGAVTYTANFDTQYMLTTAANASCGSITPATGYQPAGNVVVTATPAMGYTFTGFTGALTGITNPQTLNLTAPSTVTANFSITPSVTINASPGTTICSGQQVTFTATPVNGGASPQYRWFKNSTLIPGETNSTLIISTLANGDKIKAELTSNIPCPSQATVESSETTITVTAQPVGPTLSAKLPNASTICVGGSVSATFNAGSGGVGCTDDFVVIIDGGSPVAYTPGTNVGSTATTSIAIQGRRANCTAGINCTGTNYVTLASWTISAQPVGPTLSAKTPNIATICAGTAVSATFNAGSGSCSDDFVVIIDGGTPVAYTPGTNVGATATTSIAIQGRRANCAAGTNCTGTNYVTLASWTVVPQPVSPTLNVKTPNATTICLGESVSATFNAGSGGLGCSDDYVAIIDGGTPVAYTPGATIGATATTSIVIQGRRANCSTGTGCNGTAYVTLASWNIGSLTTATISGTTVSCQNAPSPVITFTGANGTAPYTFVYKINNGGNLTVTTTNGNSVTVSQPTTAAGIFSYTLVSVSDTKGCSQNQSGTATITINTKPTVTLNVQGQTLNEGNTQTLCDNDTNPANTLLFNVATACIAGPVQWRTQIGAGAWSNWSTVAPNSQPSDNTVYHYQAACDAACPSTYTGIITLTINYRASTPQNVSLVADGITVAAGESKTICDVAGNTITFNATCAAGEMALYSVDGGNYSSTVPSQIVDNSFHNYRMRCRKADNTPSCVETESAVMSLKISPAPLSPNVSITPADGCGMPVAFSGSSNCGALTTVWYNAATNQALPNLPTTAPASTTSFYARCQNEAGCLSGNSNTVTFTFIPVNEPPVVTASAEIVCTGTEVTLSAVCPSGTTVLWNNTLTQNPLKVAFNNVTRQTYSARCVSSNGCQSPLSLSKTVLWKAFELTFINIGQSRSGTKPGTGVQKSAWSGQFITPDAGPVLDQSTQANPTIYYSENVNKIAPRFWTIQVEPCTLGSDGSISYDMLATPEVGVPQSFNTHENNAPYLMYANRDGFTELYAQNHPAYGFYQDNGSGGNVYDTGLPKGLYKLGIRYWDRKGQGSIYPSTRLPQGTVLAYQEYWFRIQSSTGIGTGNARAGSESLATSEDASADADNWIRLTQNPVKDLITVKLTGKPGELITLALVNLQGQTIQQKSIKLTSAQQQESLTVSTINAGMYLLKALKSDKVQTFKIVKTE